MTDEELVAAARRGLFPAPQNHNAKLEEFLPYAIRETAIVYFGRPGFTGSYEVTIDKDTGTYLSCAYMPEELPYVRDPELIERHSLEKRKQRNSND